VVERQWLGIVSESKERRKFEALHEVMNGDRMERRERLAGGDLYYACIFDGRWVGLLVSGMKRNHIIP
jgi:hypothetical protein